MSRSEMLISFSVCDRGSKFSNAIQGKGISHGVSIKKVQMPTIRPSEILVKVYSVACVRNPNLYSIIIITYIFKEP